MIYKIIDRFFPIYCIWCDKIWEYICSDCRSKLIPHQEFCNVCHKPSENFVVHEFCREKVFYDSIIILREFTSLVKKLIYKLKFFHKFDTVDFLSNKLRLWLQSHWDIYYDEWNIRDNIYICYVPSHWIRKYWIKWYNQSELLAKWLCKISGLNFLDISKKIKHTKSQVKLDRNHRLNNLVWSYELNNHDLLIDPVSHIYIVDDISTTWSTINELAKTIKQKYPNARISWIVIARSNK